jgi:hypothetical protein
MIEARGFVVVARLRDDYGAWRKGYRIRCDFCEAVSINGVACHEHGCVREPVECRWCGESYQRRDGHECPEGHEYMEECN